MIKLKMVMLMQAERLLLCAWKEMMVFQTTTFRCDGGVWTKSWWAKGR